MSEENIFTSIQIEIAKLNLNEMVDLLEASIKGIQQISSESPEFAEFLRTLPINFTHEEIQSISYIFKNLKNPYLSNLVEKDDSAVSFLLTGGKKNTNKMKGGVDTEEIEIYNPQVAAPSQQIVLPVQQALEMSTAPIVQDVAQMAVSLAQAGFNAAQIKDVIDKHLENIGKLAESANNNSLARFTEAKTSYTDAMTNQQNQVFGQRLSVGGFVISFVAPGILMYSLNNLLSTIATSAVSTVGNIASNSVGAAELTVRNSVPYLIQLTRQGLSSFKSAIPTAAYNVLSSASQSIRASGADTFVSASASGTYVQGISNSTVIGTANAIFIGSLLVYMMAVIVLILFVTIIVKITNGDFAAYISTPFGTFGIKPRGRGGNSRFTRNNRNMKRHRKYKKTLKLRK